MKKLYIGLMSGTSMDAVDAALVDFSDPSPELIATHKAPLSHALRAELNQLCDAGLVKLVQLAELDVKIARVFAEAVNAVLAKTSFTNNDILAIGSHGQTIFHQPHLTYPSSIQLGDPNIIAEKTGITTIADFRRRDIATGGQGAPLTPAFHNFLFRSEKEDRLILNLGGFANITFLSKNRDKPIVGFDTGPANLLLDKWIYKNQGKWFDENGTWAASGIVDDALLQQFLSDPYFHLPWPKSTGHDYFNLKWLNKQLSQLDKPFTAVNVQATLCELTAASVGLGVQQLGSAEGSLLLCGGGAENTYLKQRIARYCPKHRVSVCDDLGVPAEWMEAMAFAWFAQQTLEGKPGNLPEVTGAKKPTILGGIYLKS